MDWYLLGGSVLVLLLAIKRGSIIRHGEYPIEIRSDMFPWGMWKCETLTS